MADTQQIQSPAPFSTWVGVVLLFALFGAIAVAIIGPAPRGDSYEKMRAEARAKKLKDARDEDAKALTTYSWVDKNKGTVRLPIERAMELTGADLANKKPAPAYAIATPEPSAAPPVNPPAVQPSTQPDASATPAASPKSSGAAPASSPAASASTTPGQQ